MTTKAWGNEYRTTVVCVDSYEDGVLSGRFYNPYFTGGRRFHSMTQFLLAMEETLDTMEFPQSFTAARSFIPRPQRTNDPCEEGVRSGMLATFALRVIFRQNASWQGSVIWVEGHREQSFRSVLELILLMDNALNGEAEAVG